MIICQYVSLCQIISVSACLCHTQDVRREMAAFVPILWSVVQCETQTNTQLHEATDQTDHDSLLQQQVFVITP